MYVRLVHINIHRTGSYPTYCLRLQNSRRRLAHECSTLRPPHQKLCNSLTDGFSLTSRQQGFVCSSSARPLAGLGHRCIPSRAFLALHMYCCCPSFFDGQSTSRVSCAMEERHPPKPATEVDRSCVPCVHLSLASERNLSSPVWRLRFNSPVEHRTRLFLYGAQTFPRLFRRVFGLLSAFCFRQISNL